MNRFLYQTFIGYLDRNRIKYTSLPVYGVVDSNEKRYYFAERHLYVETPISTTHKILSYPDIGNPKFDPEGWIGGLL